MKAKLKDATEQLNEKDAEINALSRADYRIIFRQFNRFLQHHRFQWQHLEVVSARLTDNRWPPKQLQLFTFFFWV
jgi:hypothetical protein